MDDAKPTDDGWATTVRLQPEPFDMGGELNAFAASATGAGAIVSFSGLVRDLPGGGLRALEIEHYPAMARAAIAGAGAEVRRRFGVGHVLVIHRHGRLAPGEAIMMVAVASAHRATAFDAAAFLMDFLKSRAPFWKREESGEGSSWVAAKDGDEAALARWRDEG